MDLQSFLQENKRFLLGAGAGVLLFFVLDYVVSSVFGPSGVIPATTYARRLERSDDPIYNASSRDLAIETREQLEELAASLTDSTVFLPTEDFVLDGKGDPQIYFPQIASAVRRNVRNRALEDGVEFDNSDLQWNAPVGVPEIERTVTSLCVLENAVNRLFDSARNAQGNNPEALGLILLDKIAIKSSASGRQRFGSRRRRRSRGDEGPVDTFDVQMKFQCGDQTLSLWLQSLADLSPRLLIAPDLKIARGDQLRDPVTVTCTVRGVTLRDS